MIVKAWNNGAHHPTGAGYGIKISLADLNEFDPHWVLPESKCAVISEISNASKMERNSAVKMENTDALF